MRALHVPARRSEPRAVDSPPAKIYLADSQPSRRVNQSPPLMTRHNGIPVTNSHVFVSHSSKDGPFVKELRQALESLNIQTWVDSRALTGGSKLAPEVVRAIETARSFLVVLSPNTVNSTWVRKEVKKALAVERERKGGVYRVVPLLLPGIEPSALALWFDKEPVGVRVDTTKVGGLTEAMPAVLAALGERLPDEPQEIIDVAPPPVEDLLLELRDLRFEISDSKRRARAVAQLVYEPAEKRSRRVESRRYAFTAPLGVIEAEDLRWYLEEYFVWPVGVFRERAARIEAQLPQWGRALYHASLTSPAAQEALTAWQQASEGAERRFSVFVERELPEEADGQEEKVASEAAAELLALPWELLHDGRGFLFHGKYPVRVRRQLPNRHPQPVRPARLPIRVLLVSPRPEEGVGYIDHRVSALPLVEAVEGLGDLARLTVLTPPTFGAFEEALHRANDVGEPFDVVHFDGHGVYDRRVGLGGLCFEDPNDAHKLTGRTTELIYAGRLAEVMRDYRVPLVFLEACQSAKIEDDPTSSVAARLLEEGVASVVAMSHSVLVETARRFVSAFYKEVAEGRRVGTAMIAGQRELHHDDYRGRMLGAGDLRLQDWFVPVLYQEEQDPQLVSKLPPAEASRLESVRRQLSLGRLPEPPAHQFIGRSRELLALERLLHREPWVVIRGQGGEGKTTLAAELARWLVRTGRFRRAAYVSLEQYTDARGVLDSLGQQLLSEGESYSVTNYTYLKQALQPVERALRDGATVIVLDNMESVLPEGGKSPASQATAVKELMGLCKCLLEASTTTRLVFTTREPLPAPFNAGRWEIRLGPLVPGDAVRLVSEVMKREGLEPKSNDPGLDPREVTDLVEAVGCHARALVLLSREVARSGVQATTENLQHMMETLNERYPGDRANSLYASLELSLLRLPKAVQERIKALAPFRGGAHLFVLAQMLEAEPQEMVELARELIYVGLAEEVEYGHLRLDPALPFYLIRGMDEVEQVTLRGQWSDAMKDLTIFLYGQLKQDASLARRLTLLELPNLLAMMRRAEGTLTPEETVTLANLVEALLSNIGQPRALAEVVARRERAARNLGDWGHAQFVAARAELERLLDSGQLQMAHTSARRLLERCLEASEGAYRGADYDLALAHHMLGTALRMDGAVAEALSPLEKARNRFEMLARDGNIQATQMVATVLTEVGHSLLALGRLDDAVEAYEEAVRRAEELGDRRTVAVGKGGLGRVLLRQGHYDETIAACEEQRQIFEELREPLSIASAWHQIGMAYREAGQQEQAERAYREALVITVQQRDDPGEAATLGELGKLYADMGRLEDAVRCYRQAADLTVRLQDQINEGGVRSILAGTLLKLGRYGEARTELLRAIECKEPYGHAAEIWTTWHILQKLETVAGDAEAAEQARRRAFESYHAYRSDGGYGTVPSAKVCAAVGYALVEGHIPEMEQFLSRPLGEDAQDWARALFPKLLAVLHGERDSALAADPALDYGAAVELLLLLEALRKG